MLIEECKKYLESGFLNKFSNIKSLKIDTFKIIMFIEKCKKVPDQNFLANSNIHIIKNSKISSNHN